MNNRWLKVSLLAFTLAFAACAFDAQADWQYTHWGMSKNQVLLAANGSLSPTMTRRAGLPYAGLSGKYQTGTHAFDAAMLFDAGDDLVGVVLSQRTPRECASTLADLQEKYGAAHDLSQRSGPVRLMWNDAASGNRVRFDGAMPADPRDSGEQTTACQIRYEPLSTADGL